LQSPSINVGGEKPRSFDTSSYIYFCECKLEKVTGVMLICLVKSCLLHDETTRLLLIDL